MSGVPYHAWTHRSKELGGTDPISPRDIPWIRLMNIETAQEVTGGNTVVIYQEVVNNYPVYFEDGLIFGDIARVIPQLNGLLEVTCRQYWENYPTNGYELNISGVDPDEFVYYSRWQEPYPYVSGGGGGFATGSAGYSEVTFRASGLQEAGVARDIYATMTLPTGDVGPYEISALGGTYMEVRYLGHTTLNGRLADETT